MFKDESERLRKFINIQYVKMKQMAAVGSLLLLAVNLSFVIYPYIEHRFPEYIFTIIPRAWIGVLIIFMFIVFLIWIIAHLYVKKMEMYRTEHRAMIMFNPYQVYAFQPFWEMWWRDVYIPQMRSQLSTLKSLFRIEKEENEKKQLQKDIDYLGVEIKKVQEWLDLGFIPKKDFPNHLKPYYITKKEQRL